MKRLLKHYLRLAGYEIRKYTDNSEHQNLVKLLKHFDINIVLDVGANVGQYSTRLRKLGYTRKIVSFEPLPDAASHLKTIADKDPLWQVEQMGLGEKTERKTLHISKNSYSSSFLEMSNTHLEVAPDASYFSSIEVKVDYLDHWMEGRNITGPIFLKIDSQGYELPILRGATRLIEKGVIQGLQLEMSLKPLYKDEPLYDEVMQFVSQKGFELYSVDPGLTDAKTGRMLQFDGIFFK